MGRWIFTTAECCDVGDHEPRDQSARLQKVISSMWGQSIASSLFNRDRVFPKHVREDSVLSGIQLGMEACLEMLEILQSGGGTLGPPFPHDLKWVATN